MVLDFPSDALCIIQTPNSDRQEPNCYQHHFSDSEEKRKIKIPP